MGFSFARGLLVLALGTISVKAVDDWHFEWPLTTYQCQQVTISITGGVPPWNLQIVPIGQQPMYWQFSAPPDPVNASNPATATIPLQLESGTPYVVAIADAEGWNTASSNPSRIQVVQASNDSSCFAAANPAKKDYDFQVYGTAAQCEQTFGVTWTTTVGIPPYYCTVIPLDSSYNPWDVTLAPAGSTADSAFWRVNMTSGTRFTVVMHDGYGTGRGGVGEIWEVETTNNLTCVTQQYNGRSAWPAGLQVNQLPSTTTVFAPSSTASNAPSGTANQTVPLSATSSAPDREDSSSAGGGSSLGSGAIAGIAVGAAAVVIGAIGLIFWYLRRKRNRAAAEDGRNVDLLGGGGGGLGNAEPKVEPYRPVGEDGDVPTMGYGQPQLGQSDNWADGREIASGLGQSAGPIATTAPAVGAVAANTPESKGALPTGFTPGRTASDTTSPTNTSPPVGSTAGHSNSNISGAPGSTTGSSSNDTKFGYLASQFSPATSPTAGHPLPPIPSGPPLPRSPSPEFRRHEDGGEVPQGQQVQREVVDLPPLYEQVPRRGAQIL